MNGWHPLSSLNRNQSNCQLLGCQLDVICDKMRYSEFQIHNYYWWNKQPMILVVCYDDLFYGIWFSLVYYRYLFLTLSLIWISTVGGMNVTDPFFDWFLQCRLFTHLFVLSHILTAFFLIEEVLNAGLSIFLLIACSWGDKDMTQRLPNILRTGISSDSGFL